jgi:hypothetical protein
VEEAVERPRHRWEDNIKMYLEGVDWIRVAQNRFHWRAVVNTTYVHVPRGMSA